MTLKVTVLEPGDKFATMINGKVIFWRVNVEGGFDEVCEETVIRQGDWTTTLQDSNDRIEMRKTNG